MKGNKIAKSGDIVSESQLTSPAVELISAGFIKEVFDAEDTITKEATLEVVVEIEEEKVEPIITKEAISDIKKRKK